VVVAKLYQGGKLLADNIYYMTKQKLIEFPQVTITKQITEAPEGFIVELTSDKVARGVFLSIDGVDNFFDDNFFDLLPNETKKVHVKTTVSKADFEKQLKIRSMVDGY
ncbi:MAG: glycoside hydrolase family 2 protein, partial [Bacteroidales bacterium]